MACELQGKNYHRATNKKKKDGCPIKVIKMETHSRFHNAIYTYVAKRTKLNALLYCANEEKNHGALNLSLLVKTIHFRFYYAT